MTTDEDLLMPPLPLMASSIRMYLESIFVGSEDIRRQLPTESSLFDQVNADWISTTRSSRPSSRL